MAITQEVIPKCQHEFGLTYHVPYALHCDQLIGFSAKRILEVGGSLPPGFVFDYLEAESWTALETSEYENALIEASGITHQGTVLKQDHKAIPLSDNFGPGDENYNFFLGNIENLPDAFCERFDLVFSIASFEHILRFPEALERMYFALRPEGKVFSIFSPIWSAHNGHHLPKITDKSGRECNGVNCPIPPWSHLLMRPPEMYQHLRNHTDKDTASLMVYYIYNAPVLNRLFTEDYIEYFKQCPFEIERLDLTHPIEIDQKVERQLSKIHPRHKHFANGGILVVLRKTS